MKISNRVHFAFWLGYLSGISFFFFYTFWPESTVAKFLYTLFICYAGIMLSLLAYPLLWFWKKRDVRKIYDVIDGSAATVRFLEKLGYSTIKLKLSIEKEKERENVEEESN